MHNAFIDPITGVLKTHGPQQTNDVGDVKIEVGAPFDLAPGQWKWDGEEWLRIAASPTPLAVALDAALSDPVPQLSKIKDVLQAWRYIVP